jgi:hypothetical protein
VIANATMSPLSARPRLSDLGGLSDVGCLCGARARRLRNLATDLAFEADELSMSISELPIPVVPILRGPKTP